MKKILFAVCIFIGAVGIASAQDKIPAASKGQVYGTAAMKNDKVMTGKQLNQALKGDKKVSTAIMGEVVDVCEKKGCWMNVKVDDNNSYFVKMKDYAYFVPADIKGKKVMLNGVASREVVSVKELKHYAEDAHKSQAEIDAITKPEEKLNFMANSIKVMD